MIRVESPQIAQRPLSPVEGDSMMLPIRSGTLTFGALEGTKVLRRAMPVDSEIIATNLQDLVGP